MTQKSATFRRYAFILALSAVFAMAGCASKKTKEGEGADGSAMDANTLGDSDSGKAMGLQTVHFGYDSSTLDSGAKTTLKQNAEILKGNPSAKVQIEGHCDSRGGIQYNIALGEKRAAAAKKYLVSQGVAGDRVSTISYGKERLLDSSETEEAHAKNRRGNFVITAK